MTNKTYSRRDFLKLGALSLSSLAFSALTKETNEPTQRRLMRVGSENVAIRYLPSDDSAIFYQRYLDDLINVYGTVESPDGPEWNPIWYKVWGGYVHSGHLVEVENVLNDVAISIHADGQLGEVTVPYTRAYRYTSYGWTELSRLYYQSVHWIMDIITGPDGMPWYELEDELTRLRFAIPAEHMRIIPDHELDPIHPEIPAGQKRIEVSLSRQELTAFEGSSVVLQTKISSGLLTPEMATPAGDFHIQSKYASKHMGDGHITSNIHAYELMGVPWCCFFVLESGVATHGTYWHDNFGIQMSHGCVNMRNSDAKWLFRWAEPAFDPHLFTRTMGYGTPISVG